MGHICGVMAYHSNNPTSARSFLLWLLSPQSQEWLLTTQAELSWKWLFTGNIWCVNGTHIFSLPSLQSTLSDTFKGCPASLPRIGDLLHYLTPDFHHCINCFCGALVWREEVWPRTWEVFLLIKFPTSLFAKENTPILPCSITAK